MSHSGVDLHGIDAEGTITGHADHLAPRKGKGCGVGKGYADAEAAKGARIHVSRRVEPDPCEAEEITTIGDADAIRDRDFADRLEDRHGMDLAVAAPLLNRARRSPSHALTVLGSYPLGPIFVPATCIIAQCLGQRGQRRADCS